MHTLSCDPGCCDKNILTILLKYITCCISESCTTETEKYKDVDVNSVTIVITAKLLYML